MKFEFNEEGLREYIDDIAVPKQKILDVLNAAINHGNVREKQLQRYIIHKLKL
jgi:hypothetical protein